MTATILKVIYRWPTPRSQTWLREYVARAERDEDVQAVVAVGSAVRPSVPTMDLDVVVIHKYRLPVDARAPLEIDLRSYVAENVERQIAEGNDLLGWTVKFGRPVFQRDGYWDQIADSWRDRLPLPSVDVAVHRAGESLRRLTNLLEAGDLDAAFEQGVSYATHLARAELLRSNVYPASRPELPGQLRSIGRNDMAERVTAMIDPNADRAKELGELLEHQLA